MAAYLLRRLLLVVPTLFGIMVLNFFIVQTAPGGLRDSEDSTCDSRIGFVPCPPS